jgi:hypothetical protein
MKTKSKSEIILAILVLIFIMISFIIDIDKYIPGLSEIFPFIWIFFLIFDIYKSSKYLKNKPKNEIRIRSKNDSYYYLLPFILGIIFCVISAIFFFSNQTTIFAICSFLSGIILIFKGLIFIPSVLIKKENGEIHLENGKIIKNIKIESLKNVIIKEDKVEFNLINEEKFIFPHLELNLTEIDIIKTFFEENTNINII